MKHLTIITALLVLAVAVPGNAQVAYVLDSGLPGAAGEVYLPSPSYHGGGPGPFGIQPLPSYGILAPGSVGGMTIDETKGWVYCTDGGLITVDPNPLYLPFPTITPPTPLPSPAPAILTGLAINGLAMDSNAGILWMTDGISFGGFTPVPPYAPVTPPMLHPFGPNVFLTGLDWEASTSTLWACDGLGAIFNFTPGGAPVGPNPVNIVPTVTGMPMVGLAVNGSNGPGAVGIPFCSAQLPGFHICVTDGPVVYDALVPGPTIPNVFFSGGPARGMAYSNDFQILPGGVPCPTTGTMPFVGWSKATFVGPGGNNSIDLVGGPVNTLALLLYDVCPIPGGLFIGASGETLWINPLSPSFLFATLATDAAGAISAPVSLVPSIAGITFCMQFAVYDPIAPLGYCLSDAFQFTTGLR